MKKSMMMKWLVASGVLGASLLAVAAQAQETPVLNMAPISKEELSGKIGMFQWHKINGVNKCTFLKNTSNSGHFLCDDSGVAVPSNVLKVVGTFIDCNSATRYPKPAIYAGWVCYDGNSPMQTSGKVMYPLYTSAQQ